MWLKLGNQSEVQDLPRSYLEGHFSLFCWAWTQEGMKAKCVWVVANTAEVQDRETLATLFKSQNPGTPQSAITLVFFVSMNFPFCLFVGISNWNAALLTPSLCLGPTPPFTWPFDPIVHWTFAPLWLQHLCNLSKRTVDRWQVIDDRFSEWWELSPK